MIVLFLVGAPGVGKTTLARALLDPDSYLVKRPKWTVGERVVAAGHYTGGTFDGADTVPYNGVREALDYWEANFLSSHRVTIFDGDRFSNAGVLERVRPLAERVVVAHLQTSADALEERRRERGSKQNESWMRGRATKAMNFANMFPPGDSLGLAASRPTSEMASVVREAMTLGFGA